MQYLNHNFKRNDSVAVQFTENVSELSTILTTVTTLIAAVAFWMQLKRSENLDEANSLYKKCGFEIIEEFKGFSMDESTRPDCYRMVRLVSKK